MVLRTQKNRLQAVKQLSILLVLLLSVNLIWAQDVSFQQANTYYKEGKYDKAVSEYEQLLQTNKQSATVYYNLGNAYFKQGALGHALLNYERAYRLKPSDKDIKANLNFARTQLADKIEAPKRYFITKWLYKVIHQLRSNAWTYIGLVLWALVFLAFVLFVRANAEQMRKLFFSVALLSLFLALFSFYAAYSQYHSNKSETYAIVLAQNITVKSTPSNNGTDLFVLHEGTKVQVLDKVGNWHKIQLADSREGWLPIKKIAKI